MRIVLVSLFSDDATRRLASWREKCAILPTRRDYELANLVRLRVGFAAFPIYVYVRAVAQAASASHQGLSVIHS